MPESCPAKSDVVIQELDDFTWLVKRLRPERGVKMVAIPTIAKLSANGREEAEELKIAENLSRRLPEPE